MHIKLLSQAGFTIDIGKLPENIMALKITDDCINCDMCVAECPNEAIAMGAEVYEINFKKCTECVGHYDQPSCIDVCPIDCIIPDPEHKESLDQLAEKYTSMYC